MTRIIRPLPIKRDRPSVPNESIKVRVARPREEVDNRIETVEHISGPVSECPALEHLSTFKGSNHLVFRLDDAATRHIALHDQDGLTLTIIDLACHAGEVLALVRSDHAAREHRSHLYRYASDGALLIRITF